MLGKRTKILTITLLTLLSTLSLRAIETKYTATIAPNDTYLFGCTPLTAAGEYSKTIQRIGGGDSIINLTLKKSQPAITVKYDATIGPNDTYLFGCTPLTAEGEYSKTLQRVGGGDSTVILTLKKSQPSVTVKYDATIGPNDTYLFGCTPLTAEGEYSKTLQRVGGGDSTVILTLKKSQPSVTVKYDAEIKADDNYLFGCDVYTFADPGPQTLKKTLQRVGGGDSIIIVNLTVTASGGADPIEVKYTATINSGETYLFGCTPLTDAGDYSNVLKRTNGSDSTIYLTLKVNQPDTAVAYTATINSGETYLFGCTPLTDAGKYSNVLKRVGGGDSTIYLTLKVNADTAVAYTAKIKQGQTYLFGCQQLTDAGPYTNTLTRALGGDSIIQLTLKVLMPTYCDTTIVTCDSLDWIHTTLKVSGDYVDTIPNVAGGDSIVTLHLTINHSYDTIVPAVKACDSYNWVDAAYSFDTLITKTGTYVHTFVLSTGCDSVVTLPVTINHSYDTIVPAITECDSLRWTDVAFSFDTLITKSGTYVHTFVLPTGCDSVVTLPVTINYSAASEETPITECNSYYWKNADTTITKTGIYTHVFKTVSQCDSVVTLNATIYYSDTTVKPTPTEPVCNRYYWAEADTMITKSGTYTHVFQNQHGCDSVVNFTVTITIPYVDTLEVRAYYGYRIIMINRNQIENLDGWHLDSLQNDHPEYVKWHQIDLNGNDTKVGEGYYYTLANGEPLPTGYKYYAIVEIPAVPGKSCGALGRTETITIGVTAAAPALVPSLARPGEDIQVINLNPEVETTIRVYSTDGILQKVLTSIGETHCTIKASDAIGFYLVEIVGDDMKSTLRYMVK